MKTDRHLPGAPEQPATFNWDGSPAWLPLVSAAIADLKSRDLMTDDQADAATQEAKERAFTVASFQTQQALHTVREAISDALQSGCGVREFSRRVTEALGTSALGPGRMENVFRTNVASAYAAGLDEIASHPVVANEFPYEAVLPIHDSRLTSLCEVISKSGIQQTNIFRRDDPVYQKYRSPRHYQDRCGRRLLSIREAADRGIHEAAEWLRTGLPPTNPHWVPEPRLSEEDRKIFEDFRRRRGAVL